MHKVSSRSERVTWGTYNIFVKLARIKDICNLVTNIEAVVQTCSVKKMFLEISQNSQENTCARVSFLIKLQAWPATLLKNKTPPQVFPGEFCEHLFTLYTSGGCFCTSTCVEFKKYNYKLLSQLTEKSNRFLKGTLMQI